MNLDRTLFLAVMSPVEEAETERDHAGIQQHDASGLDARLEEARML